ncbi:MAG TPA: methionyl-tRNA formyltransferase [Thermoanaerobaculia bacterium]
MRVVFFGTPRFAVPSLTALLDAGFEVPLVVTQPDRPVGRSGLPQPSPIAAIAVDRGVGIERPERLRDNTAFFDRLGASRPDAIAVVAYGKLLPGEVLDLPPRGCVNVHASLLPRHRGASPVQAAILAGDRETGVVTMRIVPELDAGPLYLERRTVVGVRETGASLSERLSREGADLLVETLRGLEAGSLTAHPQVGEPTFTRPIRREDARVDWTEPSSVIDRRLRAFTPWPGLYAVLGGERVKLLELEPVGKVISARQPGMIFEELGEPMVVAGNGTAVRLKMVQRAGRRPVTGLEFVRGIPFSPVRFEPTS